MTDFKNEKKNKSEFKRKSQNKNMSLLYISIGFLYLWLRYRKKKKVHRILNEKYDNRYYYAGAELVLGTFGVILLILLSVFLIVFIGRTIYDLIV